MNIKSNIKRASFEDQYAYEVIRLINGKPLFLNHHYQRLEKSCASNFEIHLPSLSEIEKAIKKIVLEQSLLQVNIKIMISKNDFAIIPIDSKYPSNKEYKEGVFCNLVQEERENPELKIFQAELRKKVDKLKRESGAFESILVNREGLITEGSKSNLFFIKNNVVFTAPDHLVLGGITRLKIIEIIKENHFQLEMKAISADKLSEYQAAFICGTSPGVLAISRIEKINFDVENLILKGIHKSYHSKYLSI